LTDSPAMAINNTIQSNKASISGTGYGGGLYAYSSTITLRDNKILSNTASTVSYGYGGGLDLEESEVSLTNDTIFGNVAGLTTVDGGGGIMNYNGSLRISGVTFGSNSADNGGGFYNAGSGHSTLISVTFSSNSGYYGGGIWSGSHLTMTQATLRSNTAIMGGGMYCSSANNATLTDVSFISNTATGGFGGGIENSGDLTLTHVNFIRNIANSNGGGMYNRFSSPRLTHVTLQENHATDGGGMYNENSNPILVDARFEANTSTSMGGGMVNDFSNPSLASVTFISNSATSWAGGMWNLGSSPELSNVTFIGNTSGNRGGGMYNSDDSDPKLINVAFIGNTCVIEGGGIYNVQNSDPRLTNVAFSGNTSGDLGGGMFNKNNSNPQLTSVTFSGNTAITRGSVIYSDGSSPVITNSVLWGDAIGDFGSAPTIYQSLVQVGCPYGATCSGLLLTADPKFVDADGADNITGTLDDDLRLGLGSPAIDAGDNGQVVSDTFDLDQDGDTGEVTPLDLDLLPRFVDRLSKADTGKGTPPIFDLGAYEAGLIHVDIDAPSGGDGVTWGTAYNSLQTGLGAAKTGDEIWVAQGTYKPAGAGGSRAVTFQLENGVATYGGFAGTETVGAQRNWQANPAVLSGDLNGNDHGFSQNTENSYHVVNGSGVDASSVLDGFTIQSGNANGSSLQQYGGGIFNQAGSPSLANLTFLYNSASYGGGVFNYQNSDPLLAGVVFTRNQALVDGGGMYNNDNSDPRVRFTDFYSNTAVNGGGMFNLQSSPLISYTRFMINAASYGAGMFNDGSDPQMGNLEFRGNHASNDGGGMYNRNDSDPALVNAIFSGNSAAGGGGLYNYNGSDPALDNVTLGGNTATTGGGIRNSSSSPSIRNSILWGNSVGQISNLSSTPIVHQSLVQGGCPAGASCSGTLLTADPRFVDLNGPDNITGTLDDNLRLWSDSPAVDAGENAALPVDVLDLDGDGDLGEALPLDLDRHPRWVDMLIKTDGVSGTVDLGAYEARAIYVDQAASEAQTGASWADAFTKLQDALEVVYENIEVWVAQGVYTPTEETTPSDERSATFQLVNGVTLYGGFPSGGGDGSFSARQWSDHPSLLSGDIGTSGATNDNAYHVVSGSGNDASAVLDGFTITGGNANGSEPDNAGGGMYNDAGSPTVANCRFYGNRAVRGGAIANKNGSEPSVLNCLFSGNIASAGGGAMYNDGSDPNIHNTTFSGNQNAASGGIQNQGSSPRIYNSILWGNQGSEIVGDISSSPVVSYCIVEGGYSTGAHILDVNPQFQRSPGPGGDSTWGTSDDDYGDLRLKQASPAVDAGNNELLPADSSDMDGDGDLAEVIPYDQEKESRRVEAPITPSGYGFAPLVDLGAYELQTWILKVFLPLLRK